MTATTLRATDDLVYRLDPAMSGAFWLARQLCEQWLRERNVRTDATADLLVVATELCTVEAAYGALVLRACVDGDTVILSVESTGDGPEVPVEDAPRGDLRLAAALCDELVLRVSPERTVIVARRHGVVLPDPS
jgi:hypothetical protein